MSAKTLLQVAFIFWTTVAFTLWCLCDGYRVIPTPVCLNLSTAAWISTQASRSLMECFGISRQARNALQSIGLVQLGLRDGSCSVFRFRDVCSRLNLTAQRQQLPVPDQACEIVVDSKYDVQTANTYFAAVWLGGHGPALENIVCGPTGPRNPVWATNIVWTSDGAQMNGFNSTLLVKDATGFNFTSGYTISLELSRKFRLVCVYLEFTDCDTYTTKPMQFWEFPGVGQLNMLSTLAYEIITPPCITNKTDEFFKVAATYDMALGHVKFFANNSVIPNSTLEYREFGGVDGAVGSNCVKIGYTEAVEESGMINGVVKMTAVSNSNLPEDVVLSFLAGN